MFLVVAEYDGYAWDLLNLAAFVLGETADDGHLCIGIQTCGLPYGRAAFAFGDGGDSAGINNVEVGFRMESDHCVTHFCETA